MSKRIKEEKNNEEEIIYEDGVEGTPSADLSTKLEKLKKDLKKCQEEKQEYLDGWQRSKADLINYKKRSDEERAEFIKYSNQNFILEILPVIDNFEQAFKNKEVWEKIDKNWTTGMEFIYNQLKKVLEENGVIELNPINQNFDPNAHHSVETIEIEDKSDDGKIIEVLQKGYKIKDKVIRHPNVKVGKIKQ